MTRTWVGAGLLVGAGLVAVASWTTAGWSGGAELSAPPARAPVVPSTIEPAVAPTTVDTARSPAADPVPAAGLTPPPISGGAVTTTLPASPLAPLVGEPVSVVATDAVEPPPPTRLTIDQLGVDVPVRAVGVELDGQLEIPDETEAGWYRLGSSPGEPGATVIAAHVSWNRTDGPFRDLAALELGATTTVGLADGTSRTYQVVERVQYPKDALPADRVWASSGAETLVLITCGGSFNPDIRRYRDNIVVYAVPVA